ACLLERGDRAGRRALLDHASDVSHRAYALTCLTKLGDTDSAFVHRKFEEMLENTTTTGGLSQYARYLNERGEAATKERFMRRVFAKWKERDDPIGIAWVASSLANALDRQGKYEEAYTI